MAELEAALAELPQATSRAAMRRALTKAAEPMIATARANAPDDDGELRDSLRIATHLTRRQRRLHRAAVAGGEARHWVEIFAGASLVRHAHLVEFGTRPRFHKRDYNAKGTRRKYVGQVVPRPFLRPAFDRHKGQMIQTIRQLVAIEIKKAADRRARRAARLKK